MSWFDTTGLASFAKSALKEAQKHIDKALDIDEDEEQPNTTKKAKTPIEPTTSSPNSATSPSVANNAWGSFTGMY